MDKQDGYNFELMKNPLNDANHLFLVQADVQVTSEDDVKAYGRFLQDIKEYVQPYSGKRDIFGIDCGDIVGDTPSLYPSYINTVSTLDFPGGRAGGGGRVGQDNVDIKYQLFYSPQGMLLKTRNVSYMYDILGPGTFL